LIERTFPLLGVKVAVAMSLLLLRQFRIERHNVTTERYDRNLPGSEVPPVSV